MKGICVSRFLLFCLLSLSFLSFVSALSTPFRSLQQQQQHRHLLHLGADDVLPPPDSDLDSTGVDGSTEDIPVIPIESPTEIPGITLSPVDVSVSATICLPLELSDIDLKFLVWGAATGASTPVPLALEAGVYAYTLSIPEGGNGILQLLTAPGSEAVGATVSVSINGIVQDANVAAGETIDLPILNTVSTVRIDVTLGECTTTYLLLVNSEGAGIDTTQCDAPNVQVQLGGAIASVTDAEGNVIPLTITPTWDGFNNFFYVAYIGDTDVTGGTISFTPLDVTASGWLRVSFNHGIYVYGGLSGVVQTSPVISGTNLIQIDVLQNAACGDYIAEYSLTIYQGAPPTPPDQGGDEVPCLPLELSSLELNLIQWGTSSLVPLPINLQSGTYTYNLPRSISHGILQLSASAAAGTTVNVYLNGVAAANGLAAGATVDLLLNAGTQIVRVDVNQGTCTTSYTLTIPDQGEDNVGCSEEDIGVVAELGGATLSLTDESNTVIPLTITPTWDGLNQFFYVAYLGSATAGTLSFTPFDISLDGWLRVSINGGAYIYGVASGTAVTAALQEGTNLIQIDVFQPYACGDYIAEYSITIYQGSGPNVPTVPTTPVDTSSSGPAQGEENIPSTATPTPTPTCPDLDLTSLSLNSIAFGSSTINSLPLSLQSNTYAYTITRADSNVVLQLKAATGAVGASVAVYLNGMNVDLNLVNGATDDLVIGAGVAIIRIDVTQGNCIASYTITVNDNGNGEGICDAPNVQVQLGGATLSVSDAAGNVIPLTITPVWDGLNSFFYVAYIGDIDVTGGTISLTPLDVTASGWLRVAFNFGIYLYGGASGTAITAPVIAGTNLIQLDVFQEFACGDYIAEYSITIYQGAPPTPPDQGGDEVPCLPLELSSLELNLIQWGTATITPLSINLQSGTYTYNLPRSISHGILQLSAAAAAGTTVNVYFNGVLAQGGLVTGATVDLELNAGTQIVRIDVNQGTCTTSYTLTIPDQGEDNIDCSPADNGVVAQLGGADLSVTDASNTVTPLTITPTWDGLNQFFYVAYLGSVSSGTLSFTPQSISTNGWFRVSFNFGTYIYGGASGVAIIAPLQDGTNLIQIDVFQPYACGDYIAEYSITIYQGAAPAVPTVPVVYTPPSSGSDEILTSSPPTPSSTCVGAGLDVSLDAVVASLLLPSGVSVPITLGPNWSGSTWYFYQSYIGSALPEGTKIQLTFNKFTAGATISVQFAGSQAVGSTTVQGGVVTGDVVDGTNSITVSVEQNECAGSYTGYYRITLYAQDQPNLLNNKIAVSNETGFDESSSTGMSYYTPNSAVGKSIGSALMITLAAAFVALML